MNYAPAPDATPFQIPDPQFRPSQAGSAKKEGKKFS
jgi:hypothetical protein